MLKQYVVDDFIKIKIGKTCYKFSKITRLFM